MKSLFVKYRKIILRLWIVLTLVFIYKNVAFVYTLHKNKPISEIRSELDVLLAQPQIFSHKAAITLDTMKWNRWNEILATAKLKTDYRRIFYFDNVWAFFLLLTILAWTSSSKISSKVSKLIIACIICAYVFDMIENAIYLQWNTSIIIYLPIISNIKIALYVIAIAILLKKIIMK